MCLALDQHNEPMLPPILLRGGEAVAQRLRVRLLSQPGTWGLDIDAGLPLGAWTSGVRDVPRPVAETLFRRQLLSDPAVVGVTALSSVRSARGLALSATVTYQQDNQSGTLRISFDPYSGEPAVAWYINIGNVGGT